MGNGKFTSQGKSYGGVSFGAQLGAAAGSGFSGGMEQYRSEEKQLMQNLGNNNRLAAANEGDPGAFKYGGRWLKIVDKPQSGRDILYEKEAEFYAMDKMMEAFNNSLIKSYAAGLQDDKAYEIANRTIGTMGAAYGIDPSPYIQTTPKKEGPKPVGFFDPRRLGSAYAWTGEKPFDADKKKVTVDDMRTKAPTAVQAPTTPAPAQFDVNERVKTIQSIAPQPKDVDLSAIVNRIREYAAKGVSKEVIIRSLDFLVDPEAVYDEAVK